ncbi:MAG: molybdopterin-dependent oxidoreductase [SAR202 cluster bacterium]|nr:molybdopterin-dependent oxidoreductase [SAR202 cluster bacterium]
MVQNMRRHIHILAVMVVIIGAIAACGGGSSAASYETVTAASIKSGDAIPAPTGDVIITMLGDLNVTNSGDTLELDMPTLEGFGLVKYTVNDPWLNAENTYTGVLISDLRKALGASSSATSLLFTALDDYQVDISLEDVEKWPILLATRNNGEYMDIENSGPTRVIFPYDAFPEIDRVSYKDLWIWNIKSVEVR